MSAIDYVALLVVGVPTSLIAIAFGRGIFGDIKRLLARTATAAASPSPGGPAARPTGTAAKLTIGPMLAAAMSIDGLNDDLHIAYRDSAGVATTRRLTLHHAVGRQTADGAIILDHLKGYCHLHKAPRTFRMDRITSAADADGVVIEDLGAWIVERAAQHR